AERLTSNRRMRLSKSPDRASRRATVAPSNSCSGWSAVSCSATRTNSRSLGVESVNWIRARPASRISRSLKGGTAASRRLSVSVKAEHALGDEPDEAAQALQGLLGGGEAGAEAEPPEQAAPSAA